MSTSPDQHLGPATAPPALTAHRQVPWPIRVDWGVSGAIALAEPGTIAVVVDVLSFSTTVSVALEHGVTVYPHRWQDESLHARAAALGAVAAIGRAESRAAGAPRDAISLSPASIGPGAPRRVVLPTPNGATITDAQQRSGADLVVVASLRNATAVARWLSEQIRSGPSSTVLLVAAGERWPDGQLRPCLEDLWGVGAVLTALGDDAGPRSPEARAAHHAFDAIRSCVRQSLHECAGGRELIEAGFGADVDIAAGLDSADVVPVVRDGAVLDARGR